VPALHISGRPTSVTKRQTPSESCLFQSGVNKKRTNCRIMVVKPASAVDISLISFASNPFFMFTCDIKRKKK
jgi:hypothetical protein